ncbi:MAG: tetratricopeptide repeat protein [archaeon]|nr:tetratricopeptide repeat protein [archaeon]
MFCENCGYQVDDDDALFCENCGAKLEFEGAYCIYCKTTFYEPVSHCSNCGKKIIKKSLEVRDIDLDIITYPDDYTLWEKRARLLKKFRIHDEAKRSLEEADRIKQLNLPPEEDNEWFKEGMKYYEAGYYDEANKCFAKYLEINPTSSDALYFHDLTSNDFEESLKDYEDALANDPSDAALWNSFGVALDDIHQYKKAIEAFDQALELKPNNEIFLNHKGLSLESLQKYDEALECFEKAIEINKFYGDAVDNRNRVKKILDSN